jgi:hypothetical protein
MLIRPRVVFFLVFGLRYSCVGYRDALMSKRGGKSRVEVAAKQASGSEVRYTIKFTSISNPM